MEDLIKREDAIKALEQRYEDILRIFKRKVKVGEKAIALDMIGCVKSLPSADRPQEWIPCSERLPEYRKLVLVTTRDLRVKPAYLDSIQDDGTDDWWSIPLDDADCALWNIVAWMPLPNPWEGADDE